MSHFSIFLCHIIFALVRTPAETSPSPQLHSLCASAVSEYVRHRSNCSVRKLLVIISMHRCEERRGVWKWHGDVKMCACVPQVKQGNMKSNLSQHPEIVPVDKLISLNINAGCFIPDAAGSERRTGML